MAKKGIALLLTLILALALPLGAFGEAAGGASDSLSGFSVKDEFKFPLLNADVTLYEHDKTGALVMYIANEDTNRVFEITFKTPIPNNSGVPHVFEHATLSGSDKYPSKALFFNLSYQTYNTYMNAATYQYMTTYPIASLSEEQLLKYADYYTDSVFHPMLLKDESIFRQEAWRYEINDPADPLQLAGTVYSEMKGAYTINRAAALNLYRTLFPGSRTGNDSGGDPDFIPEMKYEDLVNYHAAYYHPSNSLTVLYGDFEHVEDFFELLNAEFDKYEKREFDFTDDGYTPINEPVTATLDFAVEQGGDTANGSVIYYALICEDASYADMEALDLLTMLINNDASAVKQALKKALPSAIVSCGVETSTPETAVLFSATGVNPGEEALLKETIDTALAQIAAEGFSAEHVDAVASSLRMDVMLTAENSSVGTDTIPSILYYWAVLDNVKGFMDYVDSLDYFETYNTDGTFKSLIERFLLNNERHAIMLMQPVPGLKEQKDAALAVELADVKAGMTDDDIALLIEQTAQFGMPSEDDASALVAALQAVTVDSLPEDIRIFDILDKTTDNGIRRVDALADIAGVSTDYVLFDASGFTFDEMCYLKLYVDMLGDLDTENYTTAQLASLITRYMYDGVIRMAVYDEPDGGYIPRVRATWTSLDEDLNDSYALLNELMFKTKLDDAEKALGIVSKLKTALKSTITQSIYNVILYRAWGTVDPSIALFSALNYLEYYQFLSDVEQLLAADPDAALNNLLNVREALNNTYGMVAGSVGNAQSVAANEQAFDAFVKDMPYKEITRAECVVPIASMREGVILDSAVNFNLLFAPYEQLGLEDYTGDLDALTSLVTDTYLLPLLRDQYGVYGVLHGASDQGVYIVSYRDPNITQTYDVYQSLPELIANSEIDQATLDGYILSSYSYYAMSKGELTGAFNAVLNYLSGVDQQETVEDMRSLKLLKEDAVKGYQDMYAKLFESGVRITAGSASAINANSELYDSVLNPFGAVDTSRVVFEDVPETHKYYQNIRFAFENGLMSAAGENRFGADDAGTLGDLALAMYVMLGGAGTGDEAIAYLSQFGIMPASPAETPITNTEAVIYTYYFAAALGYDVAAGSLETLEAYADASELTGDEALAAFMWALGNGLYQDTDGALNASEAATRARIADIVARFYVM